VRIGDLNGDGAPDLLFVQSLYGSREITCLAATTILGERLWQVGQASADNGAIYSDLPVQIYDWDNDGVNEVLYVRQAEYAEWSGFPRNGYQIRERATRYAGNATMVVLDGMSGREKASFAIPAPADDSFAFADLTGRGRREDLVVKDRYWNIWGLAHSGEELWHWEGSVGHYPAIADIDGDGCDEVFLGYSLLGHDGRPLFEHPDGGQHQDAAYTVQHTDGSWRLLFGNGGVHCLTVQGETLWHHPLGEAEHVVAGHFLGVPEVQVAVVDRGYRGHGESTAMVYLYDLAGRELWRREQPRGSWAAAIVPIRWMSGAATELLVYSRGTGQPAAILNGVGEIVDLLPMALPPGRPAEDYQQHAYGNRADVWGDSREEVILFGSRGCCIWANARPLALPTLYNNTLYPGM
jgi:hypothetical protein